VVAGGDGEREERVVEAGLDLRRERPRRRGRGFATGPPALEHEHAPAGKGERAGRGGAHDPGADDDGVVPGGVHERVA